MDTQIKERSTHQLTYRHKLHVPLGWRLQQHSKRKTTTTKTYLLEGLVSNAISNKKRHDSDIEENLLLRVQQRQPTQQPRNCGQFNSMLQYMFYVVGRQHNKSLVGTSDDQFFPNIIEIAT